MSKQPLAPDQLRQLCDPASFDFETTVDVPPNHQIIGQPRGLRAIEFGIDIDSPGYNIFVLGEEGTGRTTAIGRFLRQQAAQRPTPQDWLYVNNFAEPHKPRALNLPAGLGVQLRNQMNALVQELKRALPQAFENQTYLDERNQLQRAFDARRASLLEAEQRKANALNLGIAQTASGWSLVPLRDGQPIAPDEYDTLPAEVRKQYEEARQTVEQQLESMLRAERALVRETKEAVVKLNKQVAAAVVTPLLDELKATFSAHDETVLYLGEVQHDLIENAYEFLPGESPDAPPADYRKYTVNLVVDHSRTAGAPVMVEMNPTYSKLLGRIEHESRLGALTTDFTLIRTGALHEANGGYLVLRARDLLYEPQAWDALKRSLLSGFVRTEDISMRGALAATKSLDPEPIPLDLKVLLVGVPSLYYYLADEDEDFASIFKVKADFTVEMARTPETEQLYAAFVASRCAEESLLPFDRTAVAKMVEFGSRLAEDQRKLSTRFGEVANLLRESSYWARQAGRNTVSADDVRTALDEKLYRLNKREELLRQNILDGAVFVDTEGSVVGQVNALTVVTLGEYSFALPSRITARTYVGHGGIGQIDRDTSLAGPIHNKGLLIFTSYFNGTYAAHRSLSFGSQITFEQNYGTIDGDSASCTELFALLSSLSGYSIKQAIAATGSINQRGDMQPIGAVNEKIEGYFAVCAARGLTGDQGVIIPQANLRDLMLDERVIDAVREGKFHIWAIEHVDEGIEILTGVPAGVRKDGRFPERTVHHAVQKRLRELAKGHNRDHDDEQKPGATKPTRRKPAPKRKRPNRKLPGKKKRPPAR